MIEELKKNNYMIVKDFISEERARNLSSEFKSFCEENNISGDTQINSSMAMGNYISFLELLCEKVPTVSELIGETVLPTYNYARVYLKNSVLKKHTDRPSCEVSLTVHLDGDKEWPIYVQTPNKSVVPVYLNSGDALVYLGQKAPHWRNEYEGEYYTQVFLHYITSRGKNLKYVFDLPSKIEEHISKQQQAK